MGIVLQGDFQNVNPNEISIDNFTMVANERTWSGPAILDAVINAGLGEDLTLEVELTNATGTEYLIINEFDTATSEGNDPTIFKAIVRGADAEKGLQTMFNPGESYKSTRIDNSIMTMIMSGDKTKDNHECSFQLELFYFTNQNSKEAISIQIDPRIKLRQSPNK